MYGKIFTGILRYTFLINPEGEIVKTWKKVQTEIHAQEVEKVLREAIAQDRGYAGSEVSALR